MTNRETARQNVIDSVTEAAQKSHERNYEKLHVRRDGTVTWFECINRSEDLIDREATGFQPVPSVGVFGTGSYECNCDHCQSEEYATKAEAISDAVSEGDSGQIETDMLIRFDLIEQGYFDDEKEG